MTVLNETEQVQSNSRTKTNQCQTRANQIANYSKELVHSQL